MKTGMAKYWKIGLSVLVGIGMFLFWYVVILSRAISALFMDW